MSRCFPYPPPPPYYEEGLIESIKLQKEREKAKKERSKEKKREKKEKREKAGQENSDCKVHSHNKRKYEEKSRLDQKDGYNAKATTASSMEQLEKSGLTEEHEQPCSIQNTYDSSESSQDSSKRRKLVATNVSQAHHGADIFFSCEGSILRFRLPLVKQKDPIPASMPIAKQKGRTPPASMPIAKQKGRTPPASMPIVKQKDLISSESMPIMKQKDPVSPATMPTVKQKDLKSPATVPTLNQTDLALTRTSEEPCFSGGLELETAETPYSKSVLKRNSKICKMERQFEELTANWNPPPLQLEHSDMGNQDWLFGSTKRCSGPDANRCKTSTEGSLSHLRNLLVDLKPSAVMPALNQIDLVLTRTSKTGKETCFSGRVMETASELERQFRN
ncbi:stress response protein nst1 [Cocos nucifera]|uniref:Stress response protein nst1 n=1 Tax=Cocos nucifera TaxID=13894 RepID=A0A8K0N7W1_COCNU|nr:stress response protein nst1 [Cocos nucifera]